MATQVHEVELSEPIEPIIIENGYRYGRILVRHSKVPIGWIPVSYLGKQIITAEEIREMVKNQFGWLVARNFLANETIRPKPAVNATPISVIVCTKDRPQLLSACLKAIIQNQYPLFEIIVVDNAPSSEDTKLLLAQFPVRYVREERVGLDWARNRGIKEARYPIVAFTDDDARVDHHWLHAINEAFTDENVMAVSGLVCPAELETTAQRMFEFGYGGMGHGFNRRYITRTKLSNRQLLWASSFGIGANMAFRTNVFEKIGGFDIGFDVGTPTRGGGDVEMFFRVVESGYTMLYDPAVFIWHIHRRTMSALFQQVKDNGTSTGCFLIHVLRHKKVKKRSVLRFLAVDWLWKWNISNLRRKKKHFSRKLSLYELRGLIRSPRAYHASRKAAQEVPVEL